MAHFDCVIDTNPMAREIESVSDRINRTTAAVIGMQAAVIQAEGEAADHVCDNVNRGFYALIHSQISQKIARLQSEVDSHLMKLNQHRKQLLGIRARMERDYGMISSRYFKLFNALNKNLELRVFELDKPTINFAVRDTNTIMNRTKLLPATVPLSQIETLGSSQRIVASNIKHRGFQAIESMDYFLNQMKQQERLTERILLPINTNESAATILLPVVVTETTYDQYDNTRKDIAFNDSTISKHSSNAIRSGVNEAQLEWNNQERINDEIASEFNRYLSDSNASQRVKDMAQRMFMANKFQTLK